LENNRTLTVLDVENNSGFAIFQGLGVGDQVFGIGLNDDEDDASSDFYSAEKFSIVWRTGVTSSDLSGKTWKKITAPIITGTFVQQQS
jgi:hypothetical protein